MAFTAVGRTVHPLAQKCRDSVNARMLGVAAIRPVAIPTAESGPRVGSRKAGVGRRRPVDPRWQAGQNDPHPGGAARLWITLVTPNPLPQRALRSRRSPAYGSLYRSRSDIPSRTRRADAWPYFTIRTSAFDGPTSC